MPISEIDGLPASHWADVYKIILSVAEDADFDARLVSDAEEVGIIQSRLVKNVYHNDIVICDVSAKKPNVMFELGMRLAFDKAAVVIKDDDTNYSFDTSPIEHLSYPRDLRYNEIEIFKQKLKDKLIATYNKSLEPDHSMYLKEFGDFTIKHLDKKEVSKKEYLLKGFEELQSVVLNLSQKMSLYTTTEKPEFRSSNPSTIEFSNPKDAVRYMVNSRIDSNSKKLEFDLTKNYGQDAFVNKL